MLYAIGKGERWLLPSILTDEISENYDSENDYKAVLVERLSVNSSLYGPSPRLRRGDCKARWWTVKSFGNRNDESSRTSAKETKKTEIVYKVNHTEPSSI